MPSHNTVIMRAGEVIPRTHLQDAMIKVRMAKAKTQTEFDLAYAELFIVARDCFVERNKLRRRVKELTQQVDDLKRSCHAADTNSD